MASMLARFASGKRTLTVYARSFTTTGVAAGSPSKMAEASTATSSGVKPPRAATAGVVLKSGVGPPVVVLQSSGTAPAPGNLCNVAATRGAAVAGSFGAFEQ